MLHRFDYSFQLIVEIEYAWQTDKIYDSSVYTLLKNLIDHALKKKKKCTNVHTHYQSGISSIQKL